MKRVLGIVVNGAIVFASAVFLIGVGCEKGPTDSEYEYPTATLTHWGFDFSAGISDTVNWENNDGDVINWYPNPPYTHPSYPSWKNYLWFRTRADTVHYLSETKDMGTVELSTITNVSGIVWDSLPPPLLIGHSVVAKCKDGYAKFYVISVGDSLNWEAEVNYYYSSTTSFDH